MLKFPIQINFLGYFARQNFLIGGPPHAFVHRQNIMAAFAQCADDGSGNVFVGEYLQWELPWLYAGIR